MPLLWRIQRPLHRGARVRDPAAPRAQAPFPAIATPDPNKNANWTPAKPEDPVPTAFPDLQPPPMNEKPDKKAGVDEYHERLREHIVGLRHEALPTDVDRHEEREES